MTNADRNQINQRIALLERASALFSRFGGSIPAAIAFLNRWPTQVELYPHWQVGESWKFFLSYSLYFSGLARARPRDLVCESGPRPMILLRDFALFILPGLIAAGGWLYALDLRKRIRSGRARDGRELQRAVTSCARTEARNCS